MGINSILPFRHLFRRISSSYNAIDFAQVPAKRETHKPNAISALFASPHPTNEMWGLVRRFLGSERNWFSRPRTATADLTLRADNPLKFE
jgi:hypothetical protein